MTTGNVQKRNAQMVSLLEPDFLRRDEHFLDSSRFCDAMQFTNADGGGSLHWGFNGQSPSGYGWGATTIWGTVNIGFPDFFATTRGGPYCDFNGTTEYMAYARAAWQDVGANDYTLWAWFYIGAGYAAGSRTIASKYNTAGAVNERSWKLWIPQPGNVLTWVCNATGLAGGDVSLASTYTIAADNWLFAYAHFEPSTVMYLGVGAPTDATLTWTTLAVGVPASIFNSQAGIVLGAEDVGATNLWLGYLSGIFARGNVPTAGAQANAARIFHTTRALFI